MIFIDFKKTSWFKTVVCRSTHVHRGYGQAAHLLLALGQSTGLSLSQWGRRCSDQVLCDADNLCQVGQPRHLLPSWPLPVACAYISSMYSTVVRRPCSTRLPAAALPQRHEWSRVLVGQLK